MKLLQNPNASRCQFKTHTAPNARSAHKFKPSFHVKNLLQPYDLKQLKRFPIPHAGTAHSCWRHDARGMRMSAYTSSPAKRPIELEGRASGSGRQTARIRRQDDTSNPSIPTFLSFLPSLSPSLPFHASSCLFFLFRSYFPFFLSYHPTNANTPPEWTPSDGSSTAGGRARAGPTASRRGRCGRLGIHTEQRRGRARRRVREARRTTKGLKPPAPISTSPGSASTSDDHVPDGTHGDALEAELRVQAMRRMCQCARRGGRRRPRWEDITNNRLVQQCTRTRPPRTPTPRKRRLPHRARYTAPLSVQVRKAALSACRASG
ncbi:hypothetical protein K438DRAFT_1871011 [Mycena galopus ATCC 62051]|nr:hypothetical protein K438DRAFT_1871011 [Mycena galopus ATCC 62051]